MTIRLHIPQGLAAHAYRLILTLSANYRPSCLRQGRQWSTPDQIERELGPIDGLGKCRDDDGYAPFAEITPTEHKAALSSFGFEPNW